VKFDAATALPARGADGFYIRSAVNEPGEAIGRIRGDVGGAGGEFEGYTSAADSERKILRNVFAAGDTWYHTGDLMRRDESGFYYFVDRIGDTFRWKGENVSAAEVEAALTAFRGIDEASVYGVPLPGTDGAAGMAAIVADDGLDLAALRARLACALPAYARPKFLRLTDRIATTATFKQCKAELQREGFDPGATADLIYFDDPATKAYIRLHAPLYARIQAGKVRL